MKKKNLSLGIILSFIFDAFGLLYISLSGFLFFIFLGIILSIFLSLFLNPNEFMIPVESHTPIISKSGGVVTAKVGVSQQWEMNPKHLMIYIITGLVSKTVLLCWTYNVIKEKNRRIDLNLPKMTGWEEIDFGFKNLFYLFLVFLVSALLTCGIFALASIVPNFTKLSDKFQMIFFFSNYGIFMILWATYWLKNRNIEISDS